ncbi:MAG: hypothetical protein VX109_04885, partial [Planctomycetota bacterium]|nr:hypothetical protein [Planctomycetota bacterium]
MLRSIDFTRLPILSELPQGLSRFGCCAAWLLLANHGEVATAEDATSVSRSEASWSQQVWNEALAGNSDRCMGLLQQAPTELTAADPSLALALQQYNQNRSLAEAEVLEDRTWAWDRVQEDVDEGYPVLALQHLIRVQTTWVDPSELLNNSKAMDLIEEVEGLAAGFETEGDLLKARQALYLLNTIYDGVQASDEEDGSSPKNLRDEYEQRLRILGRKVQILSLYAPAQFHDMRKNWAVSLGEGEDFPEFNPNTVLDWREVTRGITEVPLLLGMRRAVSSHMDGPSWRPLLMEALRTAREFSSLPRLATVEEFSGLGDPKKVALWEEAIDSLMTSVESDERIDFRRAREVMGQ